MDIYRFSKTGRLSIPVIFAEFIYSISARNDTGAF